MAYNWFGNTALGRLLTKIKGLADTKVDKEDGKVLSSNDYTNEEKTLVATIPDKVTSVNTKTGSTITLTAGDVDAYTKAEIDGKISSVYKPGGSVTFANLPTADESHLGLVYNVTDGFTTTDSFVEGAGKSYPAGTNVGVVLTDGNVYKYDAMAGFTDLSGYVPKDEIVEITADDVDAAWSSVFGS